MKRFCVEQSGYVQLEASRRFLVEVPDDVTEQEVPELLEKGELSLPDGEAMAWKDDNGRLWIGYDVQAESTDVFEPDPDSEESTQPLGVIRFWDGRPG